MDTYLPIVEDILTVDEAHELIGQLLQIKDSLYSTKESPEVFQDVSTEVKDAILALLTQEKIDSKDAKKMEEFINELIQYIKQLDAVSLSLAYRPSQKQMKELQSWFQQSCSKKILIQINRDESVIAGTRIMYKGVYKDYSLNKTWKTLNTI